MQRALHSSKHVSHVDKLIIIQCIRSKVNSPLAFWMETVLQLHSHLWRQFHPVCIHGNVLTTQNTVYLLSAQYGMLVVLVPYSLLSLQSVDFSISLSELLLNFSNPSIRLCLQQQTKIKTSVVTTMSSSLVL